MASSLQPSKEHLTPLSIFPMEKGKIFSLLTFLIWYAKQDKGKD